MAISGGINLYQRLWPATPLYTGYPNRLIGWVNLITINLKKLSLSVQTASTYGGVLRQAMQLQHHDDIIAADADSRHSATTPPSGCHAGNAIIAHANYCQTHR